MKIHILKDKYIKQGELDIVEAEIVELYYKNTGIVPIFYHDTYDFSTYEKEMSSDGDEHLTDSYIRKTVQPVYNLKKESIDHVILLIHRDNWNIAGIWGTNYSFIYNGYQVQVCRFDNKNLANSVGTMYHEIMHSHDAFIKTYTGIDVNKLSKWTNWDKQIVHGGRPDQVGVYKWTYIRHKENTDALAYIGTYLKDAYQKRNDLCIKSQQKTIIGLLENLVILWKQKLNKKSTVK